VVGPDALAAVLAHRQMKWFAKEAGGVLLGRVILEQPDVLVDAVSQPSAADRRGRFNFFRARAPTQAAINAAHAASGGERIYLGEWHTHPEDHPSPSRVDLADWRRLACEATFEQDALFFLIAGRVTTGAWEVPKGGGRIYSLNLAHAPGMA
jgi:integrative and conjugative element protein (TIGR02256 family)